MRRQPGFTLVEVLVALVVMSIMAALAWKGIDTLTKTREIAQARLTQTMRLQTLLAQWEVDLRSLQDSKSEVPALAFDGGSLTLTRRQPEGMQVVVWTLREGAIYRWAGPPVLTKAALLDQRQRGQQQLSLRDQALKAYEGVSSWQFYCYWGNAWANCLSSGNEGNGPEKKDKPIPSGVRVLMQFAGGNGVNGSLMREIEVSVQ
jgi:general secretion pathway protein J